MDDPTQNSALADLGSETDKKLGHGTTPNDQAGCTDPGTTSQPSSTVAQDPKEQTPQTRPRAESPKSHPQVPQLPPPSPGRSSTPSRSGRKHSTTSFKIDSMAFYVAPIPEARAQHDDNTEPQNAASTTTANPKLPCRANLFHPRYKELEPGEVFDPNVPRTPFYRAGHYMHYMPRDPEECEHTVDYFMDSEDIQWLRRYNHSIGASYTSSSSSSSFYSSSSFGPNSLSEEDFETIIDKLEKMAFKLDCNQQSQKRQMEINNSNDVCVVCLDGVSEDANQIVYCDGCNMAVHQECYGIRSLPKRAWLCERCSMLKRNPHANVDCVLCHDRSKTAAIKQTTTGEMVHVICALWIPETKFQYFKGPGEIEYIESIDISNIPEFRKQATCYLCNKRGGVCMSCSCEGCPNMFHVTCARKNNVKMRCTAPDTDHDPKVFMLDESQERVKYIMVTPAPYSEGIYKAWCGFHKCPSIKRRKIDCDDHRQQQQQQQHQQHQHQQNRPSVEGVKRVINYMAKVGMIDQDQCEQMTDLVEKNGQNEKVCRYFCECCGGFETPQTKASHSNSCRVHKLMKNAISNQSQNVDKQLQQLIKDISIQSVLLPQSLQDNSSITPSQSPPMKPEPDNPAPSKTPIPPHQQQRFAPSLPPPLLSTNQKEHTRASKNKKPSHLEGSTQPPPLSSLPPPPPPSSTSSSGTLTGSGGEFKNDAQGNPPAYGNLKYTAVLAKLPMFPARHIEAVYRYWLKRRKDNNDYPLLKMFELTFVGVSHQEVTPTIKISNNKHSYQKLCTLNEDLTSVDTLLKTVNERESIKEKHIKLLTQAIGWCTQTPQQRLYHDVLNKFKDFDKDDIFAFPVTEEEAPGYHTIIKAPMDFSTIESKIDKELCGSGEEGGEGRLEEKHETYGGEYADWKEFVGDLDLVFSNAMTYNHAKTPFYQIAKKSLHLLNVLAPNTFGDLRYRTAHFGLLKISDKAAFASEVARGTTAIAQKQKPGQGAPREPMDLEDFNRLLTEVTKTLCVPVNTATYAVGYNSSDIVNSGCEKLQRPKYGFLYRGRDSPSMHYGHSGAPPTPVQVPLSPLVNTGTSTSASTAATVPSGPLSGYRVKSGGRCALSTSSLSSSVSNLADKDEDEEKKKKGKSDDDNDDDKTEIGKSSSTPEHDDNDEDYSFNGVNGGTSSAAKCQRSLKRKHSEETSPTPSTTDSLSKQQQQQPKKKQAIGLKQTTLDDQGMMPLTAFTNEVVLFSQNKENLLPAAIQDSETLTGVWQSSAHIKRVSAVYEEPNVLPYSLANMNVQEFVRPPRTSRDGDFLEALKQVSSEGCEAEITRGRGRVRGRGRSRGRVSGRGRGRGKRRGRGRGRKALTATIAVDDDDDDGGGSGDGGDNNSDNGNEDSENDINGDDGNNNGGGGGEVVAMTTGGNNVDSNSEGSKEEMARESDNDDNGEKDDSDSSNGGDEDEDSDEKLKRKTRKSNVVVSKYSFRTRN